MWDLPGPGLEPASPALVGGFLTTAPPGKSTPFTLEARYKEILKATMEYSFVCTNFFFFFQNKFYLFLAALGLRCCVRAFSSHGLRCGVWASHCGGFSCFGARSLGALASVVVAHGLSCSVACGIFPDQGSNPRPLHWQADS